MVKMYLRCDKTPAVGMHLHRVILYVTACITNPGSCKGISFILQGVLGSGRGLGHWLYG